MLIASRSLLGLGERQTKNILLRCGLPKDGNIAVLMIETVKKRSYAKVGEYATAEQAIRKAKLCRKYCLVGKDKLLFTGVLYDSNMNIYNALEMMEKAA